MTPQFIEQNIVSFAILIVWTLIWKGFALWKAALRREKWWFIAMLVINDAGILSILYLFIFSERPLKKSTPKEGVESGEHEGGAK